MDSFALLLEIACLVLAIAFVAQQISALIKVYKEEHSMGQTERQVLSNLAYRKINL